MSPRRSVILKVYLLPGDLSRCGEEPVVGPFPIWEVMNDESMRLNQVEFVPPKPRLHIPPLT